MNREFLQLLREAGIPEGTDWRDVLLTQNYAPIPALAGTTARYGRERGFNMVVRTRGVPTFFCKCRPREDRVLKWETTIRTCLAGTRDGGLSVPQARVVLSSRMALQVGPYLAGVRYGRVVERQSTMEYLDTMRILLEGLAVLVTLARANITGMGGPEERIVLREAADESLADISGMAAFEPGLRAALDAAVSEGGVVPSVPQHGDYWCQNVLLTDRHVWAIDFDIYGEVRVPLYDDLAMLYTTIGLRRAGAGDVLERLMADEPEALACRRLLGERSRAMGLADDQVDGALVYYLAHMASTVSRRGGPVHAAPYVETLRQAARLLATGRRGLLAAR